MHPAKPFAAAVTGSTMESVTGHSPQPDPLRPDPLRPDAARPEPPTTDPQRHDVRRHDPQSGRFRAPEVDDFRPIPGDQGPGGPPATDPLQSGTQAGGPGPTTAGGGFTGRPGGPAPRGPLTQQPAGHPPQSRPFPAQPPSRPFPVQPPSQPFPAQPPSQPLPAQYGPGPAQPVFNQGGYPASGGPQFGGPQFGGPPGGGPHTGALPPVGPQPGSPPPCTTRRPGLLSRSTILVLISAVAGLVTYTMGFVDWVSFDATTTEDDLSRWGEDLTGIPGFFSYEVLLNPGKFLILMGALAVAAVLLVVPAYRRALPVLAVLASGGWFALLSAALALPGVVDLGAGAIIALIFGFLQAAALVAAAFVQGLERT